MLLAGCGGSGGSSAGAASAAAGAASSPSVSAAESSSASPGVYSDAVRIALSDAMFKAGCTGDPSAPYLTVAYRESDHACVMNIDSELLAKATFGEACGTAPGDDVTATIDLASGTCSLGSKYSGVVKDACDTATDGTAGLTVTFDEATGTCLMKVLPETVISAACDSKAAAPLDASIDAGGLSCVFSLPAEAVPGIVAQEVSSGKLVCTDGSPKDQPSEPCVLASIAEASAGQ